MKTYLKSTIVTAEQLNDGTDEYQVTNESGTTYQVSKEEFENTFIPSDALPFGLAVEALKKGKKVARAGWNGKGMFLYHVPAGVYTTVTDIARAEFGETVQYGAYLAMKTAQGNVVPWLASQTDVLADDWTIVE